MNLKYLGWGLAGGAVGAALALLVAPASGRETRRRLARQISDGRDELVFRGHRAVDQASEYLSTVVNG